MILPDGWEVWTAIHEAGHAVVALASGVKVHAVSILPDAERAGRCDARYGRFPSTRVQLAQTLAGAAAVKHRWPDHWRLAMGTGHGDILEAEKLAAAVYGEENVIVALNCALDVAERLVEEFWPEITAMATRLLDEKLLLNPGFPRLAPVG